VKAFVVKGQLVHIGYAKMHILDPELVRAGSSALNLSRINIDTDDFSRRNQVSKICGD